MVDGGGWFMGKMIYQESLLMILSGPCCAVQDVIMR